MIGSEEDGYPFFSVVELISPVSGTMFRTGQRSNGQAFDTMPSNRKRNDNPVIDMLGTGQRSEGPYLVLCPV